VLLLYLVRDLAASASVALSVGQAGS
jgi:hypothetical protein